ncbi:MAG TPA: TolC family protein [Gemmatimonadaceae bacterium]|nr:TolC family protein [Gemmatimonadaceae bacterium]
MNFTRIIAAARRAHLRRALWLAIVCAIAPASIEAQEPATSHLRLSDAYREAQSANPRFAAARARARAANARISAAGLPPDPELQLGFMNYGLPDLEPMDPLGMTQLQLMQMVPIGGKLHLSKNIARAQASASGFRATDAGWEVRGEVAMAFYDLYRTDRGLDVARGTIRLLQDVRSIAESMYRVGEGRQADVLRAQVELARMIEDTVRMTTMRTGMAARLNAVLDRPFDAVVSPPLLPVFPDTIPALETLVMLAQAERPMVKAGEVELDAANAQLKLARREIWPDLTVGLQYGQRRGEMGLERMGSLMVGASIPVFARSRQLRMREEAAAMREMAAADLTAMRAETRARVTEAYANLVRARNLAALYRTTILPQAEATVSSALAAYRVGSVDFMTLLDSRMTVNTYLQELLALDAEQGKVWAELEMLTGRELFDANATAEPAGRETR